MDHAQTSVSAQAARKEEADGAALSAEAAQSSGSSAPVPRRSFDNSAILQLVIEGAELAASELQRYEERQAHAVSQRTQQRAEAEAELQTIPAMPAAEQAARQAHTLQLQQLVAQCTRWLDAHAQWVCWIRNKIELARAVEAHHLAVSIRALGHLCRIVWELAARMTADSPHRLGPWMQRVDALFTHIARGSQCVTLSSEECREILLAAMDCGALGAVPALMQQANNQHGCELFSRGLAVCCGTPRTHFASLQPYLRLFEYGLDPTRIFPKQPPPSALQMAGAFIRDHPPPAVEAAAESSVMAPAAASSSSAPAHVEPIPSVLAAVAAQQPEPTQEAEQLRRAVLHARFMHALIPAWRFHSTKVRALLLDAAPDRLIPPLVDIVSRYLALEGLSSEPAAKDAANMDW